MYRRDLDSFVNGYCTVAGQIVNSGQSITLGSDATAIDVSGGCAAEVALEGGTAQSEANGSGQLLVTYDIAWQPAAGAPNPAPRGSWFFTQADAGASAGCMYGGLGSAHASGTSSMAEASCSVTVSAPDTATPPNYEPSPQGGRLTGAKRYLSSSYATAYLTMQASHFSSTAAVFNGGCLYSDATASTQVPLAGGCVIGHDHVDITPTTPPPA
jgi:hypothetical protein